MAAGIDRETRYFLANAPAQGVKQLERFNLVVKQLNPQGHFAVLSRKHINGVASHPELAAGKIDIIALVLHAHQLSDQVALPEFVAGAKRQHHLVVGLRLADAVDGRDGGNDHHIPALEHAFGATQTHLLNVLVDGRVFFDEQVPLRHIGLGLVVVVVTDKVLDRVFREKLTEFAVELSRQGFVGSKHDGRPTQPRDDIGHGEGFSGTGHPQQGLEHLAILHPGYQLIDGAWLVPGRRIRLVQLKWRIVIPNKSTGQGRHRALRARPRGNDREIGCRYWGVHG